MVCLFVKKKKSNSGVPLQIYFQLQLFDMSSFLRQFKVQNKLVAIRSVLQIIRSLNMEIFTPLVRPLGMDE